MTNDELVRAIQDDLDALEAIPPKPSGPATCFSCLQSYPSDEFLGECRACGTAICGLGTCKGTCLCSLMEEDDVDDE
jgi:hypothetical protein